MDKSSLKRRAIAAIDLLCEPQSLQDAQREFQAVTRNDQNAAE